MALFADAVAHAVAVLAIIAVDWTPSGCVLAPYTGQTGQGAAGAVLAAWALLVAVLAAVAFVTGAHVDAAAHTVAADVLAACKDEPVRRPYKFERIVGSGVAAREVDERKAIRIAGVLGFWQLKVELLVHVPDATVQT